MTLLVFGRTGQLAGELARLAPEARFLGRAEADLADPVACAAAVVLHRPSAVVIAAAYTAVDRAEAEPDLALTVNARSPGAIARACADMGVPLVHVSTDYVFDGSGDRPFCPDDPTGPLNAYGHSKLAGEVEVLASGARAAILRTSWVFAGHGANFVRTMLRLGAERAEIRVVADQHGGPTPAAALAGACLRLAMRLGDDPGAAGVWHYAGAPDTTWADFARAIFAAAGLGCRVIDIATIDYPTPARRPANSRLDCSATETRLGLPRPDWRAALPDVVAALRAG